MPKKQTTVNSLKHFVLGFLTASILTGCNFISNTMTFKDQTKGFIGALLKKDYDKAIDYFAMEHEMAEGADTEAMKNSLSDLRAHIVNNFGTELSYSFIGAEKRYSTREEESTPPNTTVVLIEFTNDKEFGVFKVLFDDPTGKILNINTLDVKEPIPTMTVFWLFGLLALCVPLFNFM